MTQLLTTEIVIDRTIYPRGGFDERRAQAFAALRRDGANFPPPVLETGTNRLLDGWGRVESARLVELTALDVDHHTIPDGVDPKLYCAQLNRHGEPIADVDLKGLARDLYKANEEVKVAEVALMMGRPRQTVQGWIQDLADEREAEKQRQRKARGLAAVMLTELGWKQAQVAGALGVSQGRIAQIISGAESGATNNLDESVLRLALEKIPDEIRADAEAIAEEWRDQRIFASWSDDERERVALLREGTSIVVSLRSGVHENLVRWCKQANLLVQVDRKSVWGNPFLLDEDGDRDAVIDAYRDHYLPYKPSLRARMSTLEGKALACWCAPERCHADVLLDIVEAVE